MNTLKQFLLAIVAVLTYTLHAQVNVTIGSGTATSRDIPVKISSSYSYTQQIFLKSEINRQGTITKIRFNMTSNASLSNSNNWKIYMAHTTKSSFSSNTDWIPGESLTEVFAGIVAANPPAGWYEITLNTPFVYNNTQNLVVAVDDNQATSNFGMNYYSYVWTPATNSRTIIFGAGSNVSPTNPAYYTTGVLSNNVNQIQFEFLVPAGGDNPTNFVATATEGGNGELEGSYIGLSWNLNSSNDSVMLVWNNTNEFGTPVNGVNYANGAEIPGGGTVLITFPVESYRHKLLSDNTPYYYKIWSKASYGGYSTGLTASATTLCTNISPPYFETFPEEESYSFPPCWKQRQGILTDTLVFGTDPLTFESDWWKQYFARADNIGSKAPALNIAENRADWLITPAIDLGTDKTMYLQFDIAYTSYTGSGETIYPSMDGYDDKFAIVVSTDRGETWYAANTLRLWDNDDSEYVLNNIPHYRITETISLAGYTGVVKIGFYGESTVYNANNQIFIDNLEISSCPKPTAINTTNITTSTALLSWEYDGPAGIVFDIYHGITSSIIEPTQETSPTVGGISSTNYQLSGLAHVNEYTYYIRSNGGGGDVGSWQGPYTFETEQIPAKLPYTDGFETWPYGWEALNKEEKSYQTAFYQWYYYWVDYPNIWSIGTETASTGTRSAYISYNNEYSYINSTSIVNLYRDISFPSSDNSYKIKFDWKCNGDYENHMTVHLIPDSIIPYYDIDINDYKIGKGLYDNTRYYGTTEWVNETIEITNADFAGETRRLVFKWWSSEFEVGANTYQPPAAIDNIEVFTFNPLSTKEEEIKTDTNPVMYHTNKQIHIKNLKAYSTIEIYNMLGQQVFQTSTATSNSTIINSEQLNGVYLVSICHNDKRDTKKITIQ